MHNEYVIVPINTVCCQIYWVIVGRGNGLSLIRPDPLPKGTLKNQRLHFLNEALENLDFKIEGLQIEKINYTMT